MKENKPKFGTADNHPCDSTRRDELFRVALLYAALVILFLVGFFINNLEYENY